MVVNTANLKTTLIQKLHGDYDLRRSKTLLSLKKQNAQHSLNALLIDMSPIHIRKVVTGRTHISSLP